MFCNVLSLHVERTTWLPLSRGSPTRRSHALIARAIPIGDIVRHKERECGRVALAGGFSVKLVPFFMELAVLATPK